MEDAINLLEGILCEQVLGFLVSSGSSVPRVGWRYWALLGESGLLPRFPSTGWQKRSMKLGGNGLDQVGCRSSDRRVDEAPS